MKANEFVKKFGWEYSKKCLESCGEIIMLESSRSTIMVASSDLKRLVESYDLVEKVGGIDKAKLLLRMRIAAELYDSADEIEQAIEDVESCSDQHLNR